MARKAAKRRGRGRAKRIDARGTFGTGVELVRAAASILDQEMAVGVTAAQAVQRRVASERRVEASDFKEAMTRFQTDARDVVTALDAQLSGTQLNNNVELAKRLITRANDMIDLAVGVATTTAEITNEFLQQNARVSDAGPAAKRRRRR